MRMAKQSQKATTTITYKRGAKQANKPKKPKKATNRPKRPR